MKGLYQNMFAVVEAIDDCLEKHRLMPALVLLYSAIDAVASLERQFGEHAREYFPRWVDAYMLKNYPLPCTSLELYAARCGIVHGFAAESNLSNRGLVRRVFYAWGTGKAEDLQKAADLLHTTDCVSVQVEDAVSAFRKGLANYLDEVNADKVREERISRSASLWLVNMQRSTMEAFLNASHAASKDCT